MKIKTIASNELKKLALINSNFLFSSSSLKIFTALNRMDESKFSIKETDLTENKYPNLILNEIKSKGVFVEFLSG